ncbi:hypothetical protein P4O66_019367, partial [Electrophorus voltai]
MGDLVPRDITDILALQCKVSKGKNKRGSSLGRAFSWFKGSKQTRNVSNGQSHSGSLRGRTGEDTTIRQTHTNQDSSKEWLMTHQISLTLSFSSVACSYLRAKHTRNGDRVQWTQRFIKKIQYTGFNPEQWMYAFRDLTSWSLILISTELEEEARGVGGEAPDAAVRCFLCIGNIELVGAEINAMGNSISKKKVKASVTGHHSSRKAKAFWKFGHLDKVRAVSPNVLIVLLLVQSRVIPNQDSNCQERAGLLGFDNTGDYSITAAMSSHPVLTRQGMEKGVLLRQRPDPDDSDTVIIPPTVGRAPITNYEGARVHLQDIEALQEFRDEQLLRHHIQTVYKDDMLLTCKLGPRMSPIQRPKSLAIPVVPGPVHQIIQTHINESHSHSISIAVTTVNNNVPPPPSTAVPRELFNIPPPP